jgi:hypothetical protein
MEVLLALALSAVSTSRTSALPSTTRASRHSSAYAEDQQAKFQTIRSFLDRATRPAWMTDRSLTSKQMTRAPRPPHRQTQSHEHAKRPHLQELDAPGDGKERVPRGSSRRGGGGGGDRGRWCRARVNPALQPHQLTAQLVQPLAQGGQAPEARLHVRPEVRHPSVVGPG